MFVQELPSEVKIEGRIEVTGTQRRRRKQLLDDRLETRRYCNSKNEALVHLVWATRFVQG
jgi:hypothetical protein